jgi:hypothetical protein
MAQISNLIEHTGNAKASLSQKEDARVHRAGVWVRVFVLGWSEAGYTGRVERTEKFTDLMSCFAWLISHSNVVAGGTCNSQI